jgi:hypothetical protein
MRRLLAALLFVLGTAFPAWADDWTTFTDASGTFSLSVPQAPAYSSVSTTRPDGSTVASARYMIEKPSVAMLAMVGDFTGMGVDPEKAVDQAVAGTQSEGRTLLSNTAVTIDGHVGRDIKLTDPDGNALADRLFFFNDHLYQIITVAKPAASQDEIGDIARFAGSLHFLR